MLYRIATKEGDLEKEREHRLKEWQTKHQAMENWFTEKEHKFQDPKKYDFNLDGVRRELTLVKVCFFFVCHTLSPLGFSSQYFADSAKYISNATVVFVLKPFWTRFFNIVKSLVEIAFVEASITKIVFYHRANSEQNPPLLYEDIQSYSNIL